MAHVKTSTRIPGFLMVEGEWFKFQSFLKPCLGKAKTGTTGIIAET